MSDHDFDLISSVAQYRPLPKQLSSLRSCQHYNDYSNYTLENLDESQTFFISKRTIIAANSVATILPKECATASKDKQCAISAFSTSPYLFQIANGKIRPWVNRLSLSSSFWWVWAGPLHPVSSSGKPIQRSACLANRFNMLAIARRL